jgi:hypothetical protein
MREREALSRRRSVEKQVCMERITADQDFLEQLLTNQRDDR